MKAALTAVVFLVLASVGSAATSGLRGVVTRGPTRPVCIEGQPCSAPAANLKLTFKGRLVARTTTTDGQGRYRITLAAGTYAVVIAGTHFGYQPRTVVVPAGRVGVRNIAIDTGIR